MQHCPIMWKLFQSSWSLFSDLSMDSDPTEAWARIQVRCWLARISKGSLSLSPSACDAEEGPDYKRLSACHSHPRVLFKNPAKYVYMHRVTWSMSSPQRDLYLDAQHPNIWVTENWCETVHNGQDSTSCLCMRKCSEQTVAEWWSCDDK